MKTNNNFFAFHFTNREGTLRYGDGRKVTVGETLYCNGEIDLCYNGMHWSRSILSALYYAPGLRCWIVEPVGETIEGSDKGVSEGRKAIATADLSNAVVKFAHWCARRAKKHAADASNHARKSTSLTAVSDYAVAISNYADATDHADSAANYAEAAESAASVANYANAVRYSVYAANYANAAAVSAAAARYAANADIPPHDVRFKEAEWQLQEKVLLAYARKAGLKVYQ